jgi:hypothetical protein
MNNNELLSDNLRETHWIGEVVDNQDPLNDGRCRVKVFGKFDLLPDQAIPWATPMNRDHVGAHSVPRVGDVVAVRFDNGNIYHPEYWFQVDQNEDLKNDVLNASSEPFNVISLVYDAERNVRIYWSPEDGLVMTTGDSKEAQPMIRFAADGKIFINSDNIFIASSKDDTSEPAVKGQTLADLLNDLIDIIKTHTHVPGTGPIMPTAAVQLSLLSATKVDKIKQVK